MWKILCEFKLCQIIENSWEKPYKCSNAETPFMYKFSLYLTPEGTHGVEGRGLSMNGMNIGKFVHALLNISKFYGEP